MRSSALIRTTTVIVSTAGLLFAAGCSKPNPTGDPTVVTTVSVNPPDDTGTSGAGPGPTGAATSGTEGGGSGPGPAGGGPGNPGGPAPATSATVTKPTIVYFRVQQKPSCPSGTTANPIAGTPVILEWKVTNADKVTLSVDGPGVYGDGYAPTGAETLNFPCSGEEGDTQRHTYLLTVTNAGGKQTKQLAVTATVHKIVPV